MLQSRITATVHQTTLHAVSNAVVLRVTATLIHTGLQQLHIARKVLVRVPVRTTNKL